MARHTLSPPALPHVVSRLPDQVLVVDKQGWLAIFSLKMGRLMATKQLASTATVSICSVLGRQLYAVTTEKVRCRTG